MSNTPTLTNRNLENLTTTNSITFTPNYGQTTTISGISGASISATSYELNPAWFNWDWGGGLNSNISPAKEGRASKIVAEMEARLNVLEEEYQSIRRATHSIMGVLGITILPGQDIKISSALKQIAFEIERRIDMNGIIDTTIRL